MRIPSRARIALSLTCAYFACGLSGCHVSSANGDKEKGTSSSSPSYATLNSTVSHEIVGFGWSHALVALVESWHFMRTGETIPLNPESLGFYHLAEAALKTAHREPNLENLSTLPIQEGNQYLYTDTFRKIELDASTNWEMTSSLTLLAQYGIVPLASWQKSVLTGSTKQTLYNLILTKLKEYAENRNTKEITVPDMIEKVVAPAWSGEPLRMFSIQVNGASKSLTPQDFLQVEIGFHPTDWTSAYHEFKGDFRSMLAAARRALARGLVLPILLQNNKTMDHFIFGIDNEIGTERLPLLLVGIVDEGLSTNHSEVEMLKAQFGRDPEDITYLIVRNDLEVSTPTNTLPRGHYRVDKGYLKKILALQNRIGFDILIPKDVVAAPFKAEEANPRVAQRPKPKIGAF